MDDDTTGQCNDPDCDGVHLFADPLLDEDDVRRAFAVGAANHVIRAYILDGAPVAVLCLDHDAGSVPVAVVLTPALGIALRLVNDKGEAPEVLE